MHNKDNYLKNAELSTEQNCSIPIILKRHKRHFAILS